MLFRHLPDIISDGQCSRGGGARGIEHMDAVVCVLNPEIISGVSVAAEEEGPYTRSSGFNVLHGEGRDQALEGLKKEALGKGPSVFINSEPDIVEEQAPGSDVSERINGIREVEVGFSVPFPLECKHRIRSAFHIAVDHAGEMHAQERKIWIGYRVDQVAHLVFGLLRELIVIPPESNHFFAEVHPVFFCQTVSLEASAEDQMARFIGGVGGHDAGNGALPDKVQCLLTCVYFG